jgi:RPA family protein
MYVVFVELLVSEVFQEKTASEGPSWICLIFALKCVRVVVVGVSVAKPHIK